MLLAQCGHLQTIDAERAPGPESLRDRVRLMRVARQTAGWVGRYEDGAWTLVRDWELMLRLNPLADKPRSPVFADAHPVYDVANLMAEARQYVESHIGALELPFTLPAVESLACLVPGEAATQGARQRE